MRRTAGVSAQERCPCLLTLTKMLLAQLLLDPVVRRAVIEMMGDELPIIRLRYMAPSLRQGEVGQLLKDMMVDRRIMEEARREQEERWAGIVGSDGRSSYSTSPSE